jgi:hypothetical protein
MAVARSSHASISMYLRRRRPALSCVRSSGASGVDVARPRRGHHVVSQRRRSLRGRATPGDRHRGGGRRAGGRGRRGRGSLRGRGWILRPDRLGTHGRRALRQLVSAPVVGERSRRRAGDCRPAARGGGDQWPPLGRGIASALRGTRRRHPGLPRSARLLGAARVRARASARRAATVGGAGSARPRARAGTGGPARPGRKDPARAGWPSASGQSAATASRGTVAARAGRGPAPAERPACPRSVGRAGAGCWPGGGAPTPSALAAEPRCRWARSSRTAVGGAARRRCDASTRVPGGRWPYACECVAPQRRSACCAGSGRRLGARLSRAARSGRAGGHRRWRTHGRTARRRGDRAPAPSTVGTGVSGDPRPSSIACPCRTT